MSLIVLGGGGQTVQTAGFINSISLGGNTAGVSSAGTGSIVLAGGNNITLSAATAAGGETISVMAAGYQSMWDPSHYGYASSLQMGNSFFNIFPASPYVYATATRCDMLLSNVVTTSSNSSWAATLSLGIGVYTRTGSTLTLASSGSTNYQFTDTAGQSTGSIQGHRKVSIPFNLNMTPGDYWIGWSSAVATANSSGIAMSNIVYRVANTVAGSGSFMSAAETTAAFPGFGVFAQTAAVPNSIAFNQVSWANNALVIPVMSFMNFAQ